MVHSTKNEKKERQRGQQCHSCGRTGDKDVWRAGVAGDEIQCCHAGPELQRRALGCVRGARSDLGCEHVGLRGAQLHLGERGLRVLGRIARNGGGLVAGDERPAENTFLFTAFFCYSFRACLGK